ncbi:MAG: hypothetical protein IJB45_06165 [Clostridia bacterium]|nr:hypothetical protein [Clostridia bacterium]
MREKADRAKQFMPFAALTGFDLLVKERERIIEPKRERSEEEDAMLTQKIMRLKKGAFVKIRYYQQDAYEFIEGRIAQIDDVFRTLTVTKTKIPFDDIYLIE